MSETVTETCQSPQSVLRLWGQLQAGGRALGQEGPVWFPLLAPGRDLTVWIWDQALPHCKWEGTKVDE